MMKTCGVQGCCIPVSYSFALGAGIRVDVCAGCSALIMDVAIAATNGGPLAVHKALCMLDVRPMPRADA